MAKKIPPTMKDILEPQESPGIALGNFNHPSSNSLSHSRSLIYNSSPQRPGALQSPNNTAEKPLQPESHNIGLANSLHGHTHCQGNGTASNEKQTRND
ncbi:hypothetical protein CEXT_100701 [Caerostris extrusa]|uniref:Uncharacterized protein n=1 Tax=Caerostris extrusa TaxID=172846 RepID=A0AAV4W5M1_CAEEX|nr:hypothetical protein CEXT_100701 [Caerostris extrusa]